MATTTLQPYNLGLPINQLTGGKTIYYGRYNQTTDGLPSYLAWKQNVCFKKICCLLGYDMHLHCPR